MFSESIGKIEKLSGVPCQPGELGENQAGDVATLDVFHHPLSFRMIFDRLSADRFEMIDLFDFPLFRFGVIVGASFVVLRVRRGPDLRWRRGSRYRQVLLFAFFPYRELKFDSCRLYKLKGKKREVPGKADSYQYLTQLDPQVRDAILGNTGTIISFRLGLTDAEMLSGEFYPFFSATDLINLPNYHIYLKLMIDGVVSQPFSGETLQPFDSA